MADTEDHDSKLSGFMRKVTMKRHPDEKDKDKDKENKDLPRHASEKSHKEGGGLLRTLSRHQRSFKGLERGHSGKVTSGKKFKVHKVEKTEAEWKELLEPFEYTVMREKHMGPKYKKIKSVAGKDQQIFLMCKGCNTPVFDWNDAMPTITGYLEFSKGLKGTVKVEETTYEGKSRIECTCEGCGSFLGVLNPNTDVYEINITSLHECLLSKDKVSFLYE